MRPPTLVFAALALASCALAQDPPATSLRAPAVPLIAHDPYFSIWSTKDKLTDDHTRHASGREHHLTGMAWIDGKPYRFLGAVPRSVEVMDQKTVSVTATRTIYTFEKNGVQLVLSFFTPAFPDDLEVLARPLTYVVFDTKSTDDREHTVSLYFDASSLLAVNNGDQQVAGARLKAGNLHVVRTGTQAQTMLAKSGDDMRIDWGYAYVAAPDEKGTEVRVRDTGIRAEFAKGGTVADRDEFDAFAPNTRVFLAMAALFNLEAVVPGKTERRYAMVAYDDLYSVQYFNRNLRPYWRRTQAGGKASTIDKLLQEAERDFPTLLAKAEKFDQELADDLMRVGGAKYAILSILAFRQTLAAHKLVADADGKALFLSKDTGANGGIGTVDLAFSSSPFFLLFNPELLKGMLIPVLEYGAMQRWQHKFAPHDLGQYPLANGQFFGTGEKAASDQMPVEESGNMLILAAAIAKTDGDAKFAQKYWPTLTKWAEFVRDNGFHPEDQFSADDPAAKASGNANLSLKSIIALGAYADLARRVNDAKAYDAYLALAQEGARRWETMARDGDHYVQSFNKPGTWSQKYNLVWDRVLDLKLFPDEVAKRELAFYRTRQAKYGLPLDGRENQNARVDATLWMASLGEPADFDALINPVLLYLNDTPDRVPFADTYSTQDGKKKDGHARSAVGSVFMKMLMDVRVWGTWMDRAKPPAKQAASANTNN